MQAKAVVGAVLLLLLAGSVDAARGYFDPKSYEKGGFATVTDAKYQSQCGTCHFAYLPGMLPARSWDALLAKSNEHFGQALSLDPESLRHIRDFLTTNAADRNDFLGSKQMLQRLSDQSAPLRITSLPMFKSYHVGVLYTMRLEPGLYSVRALSPDAVKAVLNCNTCHKGTAAGSFAPREIVLPDVTPVVAPRHGPL
jgi:hypothetical protein